MITIDPGNIEQKQKLLVQHRRNLNYLTQQAAQFGSDLPLAVHNSLRVEQEAIATLERELVALGIAAQPQPHWQALVIDPDRHWREIVAKNIGQLGGAVIECETVPNRHQGKAVIQTSALAVVGVPDAPTAKSIRQWVKDVVKLGQSLPLILLVCEQNRETAVALRQAISAAPQPVTIITVFKDNFDAHWFSRVVHQIFAQ